MRRRNIIVKKVSRQNVKKKRGIFAIFFRYCVYFAFCSFMAVAVILLYYSQDLPDLKHLQTNVRTPEVTIQTYDGKVIGTYGDLYEDVVKIEELPKHVPVAFIAIEDRRFFQHFGIDFIGFFRAFYQNYIAHRVVQGGSTITQQLAKNILVTEGCVTHYDRSIKRKIKELLLSWWLEYKFSKSEILMMYLNRVYFGAGTYGIDAASKKYFGKPARKLSIFESAVLAGLLKAPTKYSPSNHPNYAHDRAMIVLKAMEEQGYIKSAKEIEEKEAKVLITTSINSGKNYMYYCDYVYEQAKTILGEIADDIVVVTTFDEDKQIAAEGAIDFYLKTEGENYKFKQASFICMSRDGAIQALVGGSGYGTTQFNRATQASRLAGSAFKIFVYGAAIEHGYQLYDMISDAPVNIAGWKPKNYKWHTRGAISLISGFSHSVNAVSIRLAQAIGLKKVANFAEKLGISDVSTKDLSIAIGTTAVTLKDITSAYTSFMDGYPIWSYCITEIRTKAGEMLYQKDKTKVSKILDNETLEACRELLRTVVSQGTGRAANINPNIYATTGSNGDSDAWFIGFYDPPNVPESGFSFGCWIGNDAISEKMASNSTGGRIPAKIVRKFLENVISKKVAEKNKSNVNEQNNGLGALLDIG